MEKGFQEEVAGDPLREAQAMSQREKNSVGFSWQKNLGSES